MSVHRSVFERAIILDSQKSDQRSDGCSPFGLSGLVPLDNLTPSVERSRQIILIGPQISLWVSGVQLEQIQPQVMGDLAIVTAEVQFAVHLHTPSVDVRRALRHEGVVDGHHLTTASAHPFRCRFPHDRNSPVLATGAPVFQGGR